MRVANATNLEISSNQIENIRAGMPGLGGNGGAGNGTGDGGVGGQGGSGGEVHGFSLQDSAFNSELGGFNANQINNIIGENGRNGGTGGVGGTSGGNGGQGGNGGHSSIVKALTFDCHGDSCADPGPIVNNVIAIADAKRGGDGGNGGIRGTGGNGGGGGDTRNAYLMYFYNIGTLTITNNTLYGSISHLLGGNGGLKGGGGANDGAAGNRIEPVGIYASHGNYFIYNNIVVQVGNISPDGYGIRQVTGGRVTADHTGFNNWSANFLHVDSEGHAVIRPPDFLDPGNLNFRLNTDSDMINAGNVALDETPEVDIVGRARPNGDRVDLGAYEFYFVNEPPSFSSDPVGETIAGRWYSYHVTARDPNEGPGELLTIFATTLPRWLTLVDKGDGTATLSGQSGPEHLGDNPVVLVVQDWDGETAEQSFIIEVTEQDEFEIFLPLILR